MFTFFYLKVKYRLWLPGAIFGTMNIIVTVLLVFLPETNNVELPQTIEEFDEMYEAKMKMKRRRNRLNPCQ